MSGSGDGTLCIWDLPSAALREKLTHGAGITALAVLDSGQFVSGSADAAVVVWDPVMAGGGGVSYKAQTKLLRHPKPITALLVLPAGALG